MRYYSDYLFSSFKKSCVLNHHLNHCLNFNILNEGLLNNLLVYIYYNDSHYCENFSLFTFHFSFFTFHLKKVFSGFFYYLEIISNYSFSMFVKMWKSRLFVKKSCSVPGFLYLRPDRSCCVCM